MNESLQQLVTLFGLENIPPADQEVFIHRIGGSMGKLILARCITQLGNEDLQTLTAMQDQNASFNQVFGFLAQKIPTFKTIVEQVFQETQGALAE